MSTNTYISLDLKYRPHTFDDIVDQSIAVKKLQGCLFSGKIPRTYLIGGPYGTGKTTIARLLASYLNCNSGPKQNCFTKSVAQMCRSCELMSQPNPSHPDYVEVNAGDARGIDSIRDLIAGSAFAPSTNYRVFCIDEAQQLTAAASQALLKPIEEPPPKSVWIIASMNSDKISPAIKSRCFQVNLKTIDSAKMATRLEEICKLEGVDLPASLCLKIAEQSFGHPRTALKSLESVFAYVASSGIANVESQLDEVLKDVVKVQPEHVISQFMGQLLNGKAKALQHIVNVENHERFLELACDYINNRILALFGSTRVDKYHEDLFARATTERNYNLKDLVQLEKIFLHAFEASKNYTVSADRLLDIATFECLAITQAWPKV